jgi:hypothetical protein
MSQRTVELAYVFADEFLPEIAPGLGTRAGRSILIANDFEVGPIGGFEGGVVMEMRYRRGQALGPGPGSARGKDKAQSTNGKPHPYSIG